MTNVFRELTQEVHISTCQLGFLMWETAFRQQGMFLDHWIRIENEAFSLLQAAAGRMMPSIEVANQENGEAEPNQGVQDSSIDLDCVLVAAPAPPSANVEDCAPRTAMALQAEALAPVAAKRARKAPKRANPRLDISTCNQPARRTGSATPAWLATYEVGASLTTPDSR